MVTKARRNNTQLQWSQYTVSGASTERMVTVVAFAGRLGSVALLRSGGESVEVVGAVHERWSGYIASERCGFIADAV